MRERLNLSILCCLLLAQMVLYGQERSTARFGKMTPADFDLSGHVFDSSAGVVMIADIGSVSFNLLIPEFHRFTRMKILNNNGLNAATVIIPLYSFWGDYQKLGEIRAISYNLENGKITETKMDNKSVFTEQTNKYWTEKKITFPNVKVGSIIDFSYVEYSNSIVYLHPWVFQGRYPCFWSEYSVEIPEFFEYTPLNQGFAQYDINTTYTLASTFDYHLNGLGSQNVQMRGHRWVLKDVPAFREDSYISSYLNCVSKMGFQLSRVNIPNGYTKDIMNNWGKAGNALRHEEYFGADLGKSNGWLNDEMDNITKGAATQPEKAEKIYAFVRDHFTCTGGGTIFSDNPLKTVFKNRRGNVAALNLLLIAMLDHENIEADPVILSTRDHGVAHTFYPLLDEFNYVVCKVEIDSSAYYLDATQPWFGFGYIPDNCYNGAGVMITNDHASVVELNPNKAVEKKTTTIFLTNNGKGWLDGSYNSLKGAFGSAEIRARAHRKGVSALLDSVKNAPGDVTAVSDITIDSLQQPEYPVGISYGFSLSPDSTAAGTVYFNPILSTDAHNKNPFPAAERSYPVEMSHALDENYILNMEIPAGYKVEEMPASSKVEFNIDQGFFEYIIQKDESTIQLRTRLKLTKAVFKAEDYSVLRDFYTYIEKKESEKIVLKKKK